MPLLLQGAIGTCSMIMCNAWKGIFTLTLGSVSLVDIKSLCHVLIETTIVGGKCVGILTPNMAQYGTK